jgi:hypothetical protein
MHYDNNHVDLQNSYTSESHLRIYNEHVAHGESQNLRYIEHYYGSFWNVLLLPALEFEGKKSLFQPDFKSL